MMQKMAPAARAAALTLALGALCLRPAAAQQLIQNGGFETGTFSPWTTTSQGDSTFNVRTDGSQNDPFRSTVGPAAGSDYAVTDQVNGNSSGNGDTALIQSFTVPTAPGTVLLTFNMFVDNYADPFFNTPNTTPIALDYTVPGSQQARVDLLPGGDANAFDTGAGVTNLYFGTDPGSPGLGYKPYSFDITNDVVSGGVYQLRFAEVNNEDTLYQGVDNVSVQYTPAAQPPTAVPEPSSLALLCLGALGLAVPTRRRMRQTAR